MFNTVLGLSKHWGEVAKGYCIVRFQGLHKHDMWVSTAINVISNYPMAAHVQSGVK